MAEGNRRHEHRALAVGLLLLLLAYQPLAQAEQNIAIHSSELLEFSVDNFEDFGERYLLRYALLNAWPRHEKKYTVISMSLGLLTSDVSKRVPWRATLFAYGSDVVVFPHVHKQSTSSAASLNRPYFTTTFGFTLIDINRSGLVAAHDRWFELRLGSEHKASDAEQFVALPGLQISFGLSSLRLGRDFFGDFGPPVDSYRTGLESSARASLDILLRQRYMLKVQGDARHILVDPALTTLSVACTASYMLIPPGQDGAEVSLYADRKLWRFNDREQAVSRLGVRINLYW